MTPNLLGPQFLSIECEGRLESFKGPCNPADPELLVSHGQSPLKKGQCWSSAEGMGCCLSSRHRAPESLSLERLLHVPRSLSVNLCSFGRSTIPAQASLAPQKSAVGKNHRPTPLGGTVQAALYLDECTQRCYSSVWAYDYMVWMSCGLTGSQEH